MEEEDVDATPGHTGHHITKRYRKNKFAVAVFDEKARQDYLTGFRKRKNKRRKVAAQQNEVKDRQRRLQERKEIREAKKAALLEQKPKPAENDEAGNETEAEESQPAEDVAPNVAGTTTYDDGDSTIVVTTCSLDPDDDEEEDHQDAPKHIQKPKTLLGKRACVPLGATQPKKAKSVNKPKKIVSEKRIKKLSRREKSVPKNQRSKKGGRRKKYGYLDTRQEEYSCIGKEWKTHLSHFQAAAEKLKTETRGRTLIHGDCKAANILFSEDSSTRALYDFQYAGGGLGAQDVVYFIGTSVDGAILRKKGAEDELLNFYHHELKNALRVRGLNVEGDLFTFKVLQSQFEVGLVDWMRFMAGWGRWGNAGWVESSVRRILKRWTEEGSGL